MSKARREIHWTINFVGQKGLRKATKIHCASVGETMAGLVSRLLRAELATRGTTEVVNAMGK